MQSVERGPRPGTPRSVRLEFSCRLFVCRFLCVVWEVPEDYSGDGVLWEETEKFNDGRGIEFMTEDQNFMWAFRNWDERSFPPRINRRGTYTRLELLGEHYLSYDLFTVIRWRFWSDTFRNGRRGVRERPGKWGPRRSTVTAQYSCQFVGITPGCTTPWPGERLSAPPWLRKFSVTSLTVLHYPNVTQSNWSDLMS